MSNYKGMLDPSVFTSPRRGWQAKIRIKHLLTDDDDLTPQQINEIGKKIATALKQCPTFDSEHEIVAWFEDVDDMDEFNSILDDMYDECDSLRIWVE